MSKRPKKTPESPEIIRRKRLIGVWWSLRDALGGDGWEGWSDDLIVAVMDSWVDDTAQNITDALLEASFDPRDVRGLYERNA